MFEEQENKTQNKFRTLFILTLIGILIIFSFAIYTLKSSSPSYHIKKIECNLTNNINSTCSDTIEVDTITLNNITYPPGGLKRQLLDDRCKKLKEDYWGCGEYLVYYE